MVEHKRDVVILLDFDYAAGPRLQPPCNRIRAKFSPRPSMPMRCTSRKRFFGAAPQHEEGGFAYHHPTALGIPGAAWTK